MVIIDELVRHGVTRLVLAPGSRSAPLAIAAAEHPKVEITVHLDERSAGFWALGMSQAGPHPAAVLTTSGTAVANLVPALTEARYGRVPLLAITADRPPELQQVGANQTIDQLGLLSTTVRSQTGLGPPDNHPEEVLFWRSEISRLLTVAQGGVSSPGPVQLNVRFRPPLLPGSEDVPTSTEKYQGITAGRPDNLPWTAGQLSSPPTKPLPNRWSSNPKGIVVAGYLGSRFPTAKYADQLAAQLGWPLIAEPGSGLRPPQTITQAHQLLSHPGFVARYQPEVMLVLGRAGLSPMLNQIQTKTEALVVDPWGWSDHTRQATEYWSAFPVLASETQAGSPSQRRDWLQANDRVRQSISEWGREPDNWSEPVVLAELTEWLPAQTPLLVGSSLPIRHLDWFGQPGDYRIFCNRGCSGIDGLVSTAFGIASSSSQTTVAVLGDLSFLHDANAALTDDRPDLILVVINNQGGGIFSLLPHAQLNTHLDHLFTTPPNRDLTSLAEWHGIPARSVASSAELIEALEEARQAGGTQLVEVVCDHARLASAHAESTRIAHLAIDRFLAEGS